MCQVHGAAKDSGRPPAHGRYSKATAQLPEVHEAYERFKADPALMETLNEIAMLRALFERFVGKYGEAVISGAFLPQLITHLEAITKAVERRHKMEHGQQYTVTVRDFEAFAACVIALTRKFFGDHEKYDDFLTELEAQNRG